MDVESRTRTLTPHWEKAVKVIAVAFTCFQLYTAIFGALAPQIQRSVHLSFAMVLCFILYPLNRRNMQSKINIVDCLLMVSAAVSSIYWLLNFKAIVYRVGNITPLDFWMGVMAILTVLEATRRVIGYPVLILAGISLVYCYFGPYFPNFFVHRGFSINRIVRHMYLSTEGILGTPIGVVSTFVFLFLLFGAVLKRTGVGDFFNDFANALTGKAVGGPAKVAVISSALGGTVSGSSIANVAGSGSFTIPMMKKYGYTPDFAAAVEASASTGGQIMPPVMGAAAFLMAEFTGIPYWSVALSAAIPAVLYFTGIFISVHLEAKKLNLCGVADADVQNVWTVIKERGILFAPIIVITVTMSTGMTAMRAALYGILSAIIFGSLYKAHRLKPKD
ncbi:MAG: TRAP transporter fused permease subunit, partial [Oscillospiraceae bacterium]